MLHYIVYGLLMFSMASISHSNPSLKKSKNTISESVVNDILKIEDKSSKVEGVVSEVIQVKSYTYLKISTILSKKELWLATSTNKLVKGDHIRFTPTTPMKNFYSKSLKRTFAEIHFVDTLEVARKVK